MQALRDIDYQECFAFETHHLTSMYPKEVQPYLVDFSYALGEYLSEAVIILFVIRKVL